MHDHQMSACPIAGPSLTALAMVSTVMAMADRLLADAACDEPAKVILTVGGGIDAGGKGSLEFHFTGNSGTQALVFASASTAADVAAAIQSFVRQTGIEASVYDLYGVDLYSVESGAAAFVSVQQLGGPIKYVCVPEGGPCPAYDATGFGSDGRSGDANCDGKVNQSDLDMVLAGWGNCPRPPAEACPGDVDRNGVVDADDLLQVLGNWDRRPGR